MFLTLSLQVGLRMDHIFFLGCLAGTEELLSKLFCVASLPPFLVLWLERQALLWFSVCSHWCFHVSSFLSSNSGMHETKQIQGTYHLVIPQVLRSLWCPFSLHLSESFCICFMYNVQEFQLYLGYF